MKIQQDLPSKLQDLQLELCKLRQAEKLVLQNGDVGFGTAPSNIALIKYWGKEVNRVQIPLNSSISFTLKNFITNTKLTVRGRFFPWEERTDGKNYKLDNEIYLTDIATTEEFTCNKFPQNSNKYTCCDQKLNQWLEAITAGWGEEISFKIDSHNNFPTACGIASSASGYAALANAFANLLQLSKHFSAPDLQYWKAEWARIGSGSATRSTFLPQNSPFIMWKLPSKIDNKNTYTQTEEIAANTNLSEQLQHLVIIVKQEKKQVSSSAGHKLVNTSPLHMLRLLNLPQKNVELLTALKQGDFNTIREISEQDAFAMHSVMQTCTPPLNYFASETLQLLELFITLRNKLSAPALWTLDAGPNIHLLYLPEALPCIENFVQKAKLKQHSRNKFLYFFNPEMDIV